MSRLPIVMLGLLVTVLHGMVSLSMDSRRRRPQKETYVTHVGFGTRGSLGALSLRRRIAAWRSLVLNLGGTCLATVGVGLCSIKVFGFRVANLQEE